MTTPNGLYLTASEAAREFGFASPRAFLAAVAADPANAPRTLPGDPMAGPEFNRAEVEAWLARRS